MTLLPVFPAPQIRARMSENEFQLWVTDLADLYGWRWYHTHDSRRSNAGFPDLVMVRSGVLIFAELKSQRGRSTAEQQSWLADLWTRDGVRAYLFRPSDMEAIEEVLR